MFKAKNHFELPLVVVSRAAAWKRAGLAHPRFSYAWRRLSILPARAFETTSSSRCDEQCSRSREENRCRRPSEQRCQAQQPSKNESACCFRRSPLLPLSLSDATPSFSFRSLPPPLQLLSLATAPTLLIRGPPSEAQLAFAPSTASTFASFDSSLVPFALRISLTQFRRESLSSDSAATSKGKAKRIALHNACGVSASLRGGLHAVRARKAAEGSLPAERQRHNSSSSSHFASLPLALLHASPLHSRITPFILLPLISSPPLTSPSSLLLQSSLQLPPLPPPFHRTCTSRLIEQSISLPSTETLCFKLPFAPSSHRCRIPLLLPLRMHPPLSRRRCSSEQRRREAQKKRNCRTRRRPRMRMHRSTHALMAQLLRIRSPLPMAKEVPCSVCSSANAMLPSPSASFFA